MGNEGREDISENSAVDERISDHSGNGLSIFDDPSIQENIKDDPVFLFVKRHQKNLSILIIAGVAVYFLSQWYQQNRMQLQRSNATRYTELRQTIADWRKDRQELTKLAEPEVEERKQVAEKVAVNERKIQGKIQALKEANFPYKEIALGYQALFLAESGKYDDLVSLLPEVEAQNLSGPDQSYYKDMALLLIGKSLFDQEAHREKAWSILMKLVESDSFVASAAAASLSRIVDTDERKEQVKLAIQSLSERQPEQAELLEPYSKKLQ